MAKADDELALFLSADQMHFPVLSAIRSLF